MKKIIYSLTVILILIAPLKATENIDCSGIKKLSKEYISCKSVNLKTNSITKNISNVTKGTFNKVKNFGKKINNPFKKKD